MGYPNVMKTGKIVVVDECLGDEYIQSIEETETHILVHWIIPQ